MRDQATVTEAINEHKEALNFLRSGDLSVVPPWSTVQDCRKYHEAQIDALGILIGLSAPEYTYDDDTFSDVYKDAYGSRPRQHGYFTASPAEKQEIWDATLEAVRDAIAEDERREVEGSRDLETRIKNTIEAGAPDRKTAIRWLVQGDPECQDEGAGFICYFWSLPDNYKAEIAEAI